MHKFCSARSSAKREAILDAAQACFLEHGYASTSMDLVATTAGVSKATIYAHFQGKDDLFGAIIHRRCDDLARALDDVSVSEGCDARVILTDIGHKLLAMLVDPRVLGIYRMVVAESMRSPDLAQVFFEAGPHRGKARITEMLMSLHDRGLLTIPNPWQAMDQFIGMLRSEFFNRSLLGLPPDAHTDLDRTVDGAVEVMMRAYCPA